MTIRDELTEIHGPLLFLDPESFDKAIIGTGHRCGQPELVAYDVEKCIKVLMEDGMDEDEAREFFDFNTAGAWVGPQTPIFIYRSDE